MLRSKDEKAGASWRRRDLGHGCRVDDSRRIHWLLFQVWGCSFDLFLIFLCWLGGEVGKELGFPFGVFGAGRVEAATDLTGDGTRKEDSRGGASSEHLTKVVACGG